MAVTNNKAMVADIRLKQLRHSKTRNDTTLPINSNNKVCRFVTSVSSNTTNAVKNTRRNRLLLKAILPSLIGMVQPHSMCLHNSNSRNLKSLSQVRANSNTLQ